MRLAIILMLLLLPLHSQAASLWQVQGKQDFYLFGTMHMLPSEAYPLADVYQQAMAQCDNLWLEVDIAELSDTQLALDMQSLMMQTDGQTLIDTLSPKAYQALQQLSDAAGIDISALQHVKPWAAVNFLTTEMMKQRGLNAENGLDSYLHRYAESKNLPVNAFEDALWQLSMMDSLASQNYDRYLEFSTQDLDDVDLNLAKLYHYWRTGSAESMYQQANFDDYPLIEQVLVSQRNYRWFKTLQQQPRNKTHCVAVGALHMAGPNGLLKQFEQAGYQVKPL